MKSYKEWLNREATTMQLIYEMFVIGKEEKNSYVVAFHDKIFVFPIDELEKYKLKIIDAIKTKFKEFDETDLLETETIQDFIIVMSENLHDVFLAKINNDKELEVLNKYMNDWRTSFTVQQILRTLKTKKISRFDDGFEPNEYMLPLKKKPMEGFHGTNTDKIENILRIGMRKDADKNFGVSIRMNKDLLFFSTQLQQPLLHGNLSSKLKDNTDKFSALPVIISFNVPDKTKLRQDFDMENATGKTELYNHPSFTELKNRKSITDDPMRLSKELGIYAYEGNIYPNHINYLLVPDIKHLQRRKKNHSYNNEFSAIEMKKIQSKEYKDYLSSIQKLGIL